MEFSPQQLEAMADVADFIHMSDRKVFRLDGYAGTGKTTLATTLAEGVKGEVIYGTFTGKAAAVMRSKGCRGARTIHSLIYNPRDKSEARLEELQKELHGLKKVFTSGPTDRMKVLEVEVERELENLQRPAFSLNYDSELRDASLLILDEHSMIDERMGEDLLSFGTKILALGDPAQLPPVGGDGFFMRGTPDVVLTEIHRQAADNPILYLATRTRNGQPLLAGDYGEAVVKSIATDAELIDADQVLCGRNRTRKALNERIRSLLGRTSKMPEEGDKLVCLRNNKDKGLLNGTLWEVVTVWTSVSGENETVGLRLRDDDGRTVETRAWSSIFHGEDLKLPFQQRRSYDEFDYGYALTVHKSQGSQWDKVLLIDESRAFEEDGWRWLYTGITRAARQLLITKG
jgi:exodeoxyribonuclease-5